VVVPGNDLEVDILLSQLIQRAMTALCIDPAVAISADAEVFSETTDDAISFQVKDQPDINTTETDSEADETDTISKLMPSKCESTYCTTSHSRGNTRIDRR